MVSDAQSRVHLPSVWPLCRQGRMLAFGAAKSDEVAAIVETAEQYAEDRAAYVRSGKGKPPAAEPIP